MPRETVRISLSPSFPPEAGATFFSTIAYPDRSELLERDHFWFALCRWAINQQCDMDRDWALTPQLIRPDVFAHNNNDWQKILMLGINRLNRRFTVAHYVALPHFIGQHTGKRAKVVQDYDEPTVERMSYLAMEQMEIAGEDQRNFKTRHLKPSRPVLHAAAAFLIWHKDLGDQLDPPRKIDPFFACLVFPHLLRKIILTSEIHRRQLPSIKQFRIREEEIIAFCVE
jgi:hypothetical protein